MDWPAACGDRFWPQATWYGSEKVGQIKCVCILIAISHRPTIIMCSRGQPGAAAAAHTSYSEVEAGSKWGRKKFPAMDNILTWWVMDPLFLVQRQLLHGRFVLLDGGWKRGSGGVSKIFIMSRECNLLKNLQHNNEFPTRVHNFGATLERLFRPQLKCASCEFSTL